jgi:hypothetical protein
MQARSRHEAEPDGPTRRIVAARRSTSISRLVASEIDRLVRDDDAYERARDEALAELERGYDLGSEGRLARRDELYDR